MVARAKRGVELPDGVVRLDNVSAAPLGGGRWDFTVSITEGRNREVRRLCKALDLFVERLVRVQFGPVRLGKLAPGASRPLTDKELEILTALARAPRPGPHGTP